MSHFQGDRHELGRRGMDARDIAAMMVAPENEPMLRNNCVVPDAAERFELAAKTVDRWRVLRGAA